MSKANCVNRLVRQLKCWLATPFKDMTTLAHQYPRAEKDPTDNIVLRLDGDMNWQVISHEEAKRLAMELLRALDVWEPKQAPKPMLIEYQANAESSHGEEAR